MLSFVPTQKERETRTKEIERIVFGMLQDVCRQDHNDRNLLRWLSPVMARTKGGCIAQGAVASFAFKKRRDGTELRRTLRVCPVVFATAATSSITLYNTSSSSPYEHKSATVPVAMHVLHKARLAAARKTADTASATACIARTATRTSVEV